MSLSLNKIFPHAGHDLLIRELTLDSRNVRAVQELECLQALLTK